MQKYLESKEIGTNIHYPIPLHKQEYYKEWNEMNLPVTVIGNRLYYEPMFDGRTSAICY